MTYDNSWLDVLYTAALYTAAAFIIVAISWHRDHP